MKEIICPYCNQIVTEEAEPTEAKNGIGGKYICYKKICRNIENHYNKQPIIIPYKKEN